MNCVVRSRANCRTRIVALGPGIFYIALAVDDISLEWLEPWLFSPASIHPTPQVEVGHYNRQLISWAEPVSRHYSTNGIFSIMLSA